MNILVVEDDANVALVLEYALTSAGHNVLGPSPNSREAYSLAMDEKPDIALIDIGLADGLTGTALAERLHMDYAIPSIYVTGNGSRAHLEHIGALGCIEKPYTLQSVIETIDVAQCLLDGQEPEKLPRGFRPF